MASSRHGGGKFLAPKAGFRDCRNNFSTSEGWNGKYGDHKSIDQHHQHHRNIEQNTKHQQEDHVFRENRSDVDATSVTKCSKKVRTAS